MLLDPFFSCSSAIILVFNPNLQAVLYGIFHAFALLLHLAPASKTFWHPLLRLSALNQPR
jgi:hypothetical protein